ncbi:MAG: gamma subclass chorismate mutase AroQ [Halioglobus sp.]
MTLARTLLVFFALTLSHGAWANHSNARSDHLSDLVVQRLSHMKEVAAYKWHSGLPIEDLKRESVVLSSIPQLSLQHGLVASTAQSFFRSQIEAAKEVQHYWFRLWRRDPNLIPPTPGDLTTEIRPELIALGKRIASSLGEETLATEQLTVEGLSPATAKKLSEAAAAVQHYPNQLKQILGSGILRVGTTADYLPFSSFSENRYQGIDIDLAADLAQSLGVEIQWVRTSWPQLMSDLHAGNFDIGMSGISINLKRARTAFFSAPYHRGGKTPIVRCEDVSRFNSLDAIDSPDVLAVVNPGGTNELFARHHLKRAQLKLHPDNRTIFSEIIEGRADVMFTDQIEVQRQSQLSSGLSSGLCAAMPGQTLSVSQKGFLLPQDIAWKHYVDTWLEQRRLEGRVEQIFAKHMPR